MATGAEVITMLLPDGGWVITGDEYSGIEFLSCNPITEQEFLDGFAKVDAAKKAELITKANAKNDLLTKLGITAEEAALLLG
jgi:hypothetical protein